MIAGGVLGCLGGAFHYAPSQKSTNFPFLAYKVECNDSFPDCRMHLTRRLRRESVLCDNYVMRSTQDVVHGVDEEMPGHYSDPPILVLTSLANGPKHGHAMIEDIVKLCGTRLGPGTLYGAITRLEERGWIEPLPAEERRQPYRITAAGLRILRAKLATLNQFSKAGLRRLGSL